MMVEEKQGGAQPLESPGTRTGKVCKQCGELIPEGAAFCSKCGANAPAKPLTFNDLPEWWKKAALILLGMTVLGVLISVSWRSGAPAVPEEPEVETEVSPSETRSIVPSRPAPPRPTRRTDRQEEKPSPMGDWRIHAELSPIDDIETVYLDLRAADSPAARGASSFAPQMSFTCRGNEIDAYIFVREPPEAGRAGYASARMRIDDAEPQTLRMPIAEQQDAVFFEKPVSVLQEMQGHERMLFAYKPRGTDEVVTGFDLRGVEEALQAFSQGCDLPILRGEEQAAQEPAKKTVR